MLQQKSISVVVACYADGGNVREMHRRLTAVLPGLTPDYEIVFVNDASPDNAEELLVEIAAADPRVTVVSHTRNFGSQMAFTSGLRQSVGDAVVLMDGDLQDPPEAIPALVAEWERGFDVVYGVRTRRAESLPMQIARKMFYRLYRRLSYIDVPLDSGDFSIMSRRVVDCVLLLPERDRFLRGLRSWVGFRQTGVEYVCAPRFAGESTNSLLDNFRWAKRGIVSFSYKPLELISILALVFTVLACVAVAAYVVLYFVKGDAPPGYLTMLVAILVLGAVQLICLGVVADYLGRIFEEVKQRPQYLVRSVVNDHRSGPGPAGVSTPREN